jgi:flagellar protein FlbT
VITNIDQRTKLLIEGERVPVLREKDILTPETADTPAKLLYLAVQLMYISPDPQEHHAVYFNLMRDLLATAPQSGGHIQEINNHILSGDYYKALKSARKLIEFEAQLIKRAKEYQKEKKFRGAA